MLKFNDKELGVFACGADTPVDKEGFLLKRGERSGQGYKQRWFVLKGNILFYFKSHDTSQEPIGCVVLERVSVAFSLDAAVPFGFKLEFEGQGTRVYYLSAPTSESRRDWMDKIKTSSYEYMRSTLLSLKARLQDLTGRDPLRDSLKAAVMPQVPSEETMSAAANFARTASMYQPRGRPDTSSSAASANQGTHNGSSNASSTGASPSASSSSLALPPPSHSQGPSPVSAPSPSQNLLDVPAIAVTPVQPAAQSTAQPQSQDPPKEKEEEYVLEMSLECSNLELYNGAKPNVFVVIQATSSPAALASTHAEQVEAIPPDHAFMSAPAGVAWEEVGKTEIIEENDNPNFMTVSCLPACIYRSDGYVRFSIYHAVKTEVLPSAEGGAAEDHDSEREDNLSETEDSEDNGFSKISRRQRTPEDSAPPVLLGVVECSVKRITPNPPLKKFMFPIIHNSDVVGSLFVACEQVKESMESVENDSEDEGDAISRHQSSPADARPRMSEGLQRSRSERRHLGPSPRTNQPQRDVAKKSYIFSTSSKKLRVTEIMTESSFAFSIPAQLLKLFLQEDQAAVRELESLGTLLGPVETVRKTQFQTRLERIQLYQTRRAFLDGYNKSSFKPSVMKKNKNLEMVALNLHVQTIKVTSEGSTEPPAVYDTVTMGCPAAHSLSFKSGGLRSLFNAKAQAIKNATGQDIGPSIKTALSRLRTFKENIAKLQTRFRIAVEGGVFDEILRKEIGTGLSMHVSDLRMFLNTDLVTAALKDAAAARPARSSIAPHLGNAGGLGVTLEDLIKSIEVTHEALQDAIKTARAEDSQVLLDTEHMFHVAVEAAWLEVSECLHIVDLQAEAYVSNLPTQDITHRRDIVFSQALSACVTIFVALLKRNIHNERYLHQISEIGFLLHMNSLLSTSGDEEGMLEDTVEGMRDMRQVSFKFVRSESSSSMEPVLRGGRYNITVELGLPLHLLDLLPVDLRAGRLVKVFPLLFTQGINEMQTLANKLGDTEIQDRINNENFTNLSTYISNYRAFIDIRYPDLLKDEVLSLERAWVKLDKVLRTKKQKNTEILTISEQIVRQMNGGRMSCCKSGKDRTSMSVTLEQCNILMQNHGMIESTLQQALDAMRTIGTRRHNVFKNINETRYAFNKLQVYTLPKLYRPPLGTFGAQVT